MKYIAVILIFVFIPCTIFAAGRAEADRDTNTATIEGSQFVNPAMVDAYEYINDYVFPYETDTTGDLSVFVNLEKKQVLSIGDNFNLLIGLKVNDQRYFTRNEGNFILFIHNPNILLQPQWRNSITAVLRRIRQAQQSGAILGIFNSATNEIIEITDNNAITGNIYR